jgi:hypothetical protein
MNCFDCANRDIAESAIAACADCGAGVCATHSKETPHRLYATFPISVLIGIDPPQRRIRCLTCAEALAAQRKAETKARSFREGAKRTSRQRP